MTLTTIDLADVVAELEAEIAPEDLALYRRRFNVAPSDVHWIAEAAGGQRVVRPAVWGYEVGGRPLINVRSEQVASGSGFRTAFAERRCLVLSDGFFEWTKARQPVWFHRPSPGGLVLLAGLYQVPVAGAPPTRPDPGAVPARAAHPSAPRARPPVPPSSLPYSPPFSARPRFTVLTTRPSALVAPIHDRMPVVLSAGDAESWLSGAPTQAASRLVPAAEGALVATPVSKRVNSVKNDDPACLLGPDDASAAAAATDKQGRLF